MRVPFILAVVCMLSAVSATAQEHSGWKKECREKAIGEGLWTKGKGRANHVSNHMLKDERKAFMRKCKKQMQGDGAAT